jgi:hypothetical protein
VEKQELKAINTMVVVLMLLLTAASFMIMYSTAESNAITVDVAHIQSKNKSRIIQEVALLAAEMKNLQKDMGKILDTLEKIKKKNEEN